MEAYHHDSRAFENAGPALAFLVFGAAAVAWVLLRVRGGTSDEETRSVQEYDAVSTEEEAVELKGEELKDAAADDDSEDAASTDLEAKAVAKPRSPPPRPGIVQPLECTRSSIQLLFSQLSEFGAILLYSWLCENAPVFEHGKKWHSRDFFWFVTFVYLAIGATTMKANPQNTKLLNREQTEEWKGWMQFLFLMYHYFHASEVYNAIRVFISCYVWMTGFGNFSFFYTKGDFGFVRFWQMMWRLNFLVFWLIMVHGNTFILYYINPLHTFYFLLVYAFMYVFSSRNYERYFIRWKIMGLAVLIYLVWDVPGVFGTVWAMLGTQPILGATHGVRHEWHFRSGLDHYSALFGMAFALNYPVAEAWLSRSEELGRDAQLLVKGAVGVVLTIFTAVWTSEVFSLDKYKYNEHHPYFFWIPLLWYIFIRNSCLLFRSYHMSLLTRMGKITLETYLMQHHIWLTSNAKTLLVFVPGYPMVNFLIVSVVYLLLANRLFRLTISLRAMLIPKDLATTRAYFLGIVGTIGTLWGLAKFIVLVGGGVAMVVICTLILGAAVYALVEFTLQSEDNARQVKGAYLVVSGACTALVALVCVIEALFYSGSGSGGAESNSGVASSAGLGILVLIVFGLCVALMDVYGGLSIAGNMLGCQQWRTSWEEAYGPLHDKILAAEVAPSSRA